MYEQRYCLHVHFVMMYIYLENSLKKLSIDAKKTPVLGIMESGVSI